MKKCKIITIRNWNESEPIAVSKNVSYWDKPSTEQIINNYLAQGYEVKQIDISDSTFTTVYFEKNV